MIKVVPFLLDAQYGEYAAGYERPNGQFMPLVAGIYSQSDAEREAARLQDEARARQGEAFVEHNARGTARGWYTEDNP